MTKFDKLVQFINKYDIGNIILRKDITSNLGNFRTWDTYKRLLQLNGFLSESDHGVYLKLRHVPKNIHLKDLKKVYSQNPVNIGSVFDIL